MTVEENKFKTPSPLQPTVYATGRKMKWCPLLEAIVKEMSNKTQVYGQVTSYYIDLSNNDGKWSSVVGDNFQQFAADGKNCTFSKRSLSLSLSLSFSRITFIPFRNVPVNIFHNVSHQ